jgi:hypothetical protein
LNAVVDYDYEAMMNNPVRVPAPSRGAAIGCERGGTAYPAQPCPPRSLHHPAVIGNAQLTDCNPGNDHPRQPDTEADDADHNRASKDPFQCSVAAGPYERNLVVRVSGPSLNPLLFAYREAIGIITDPRHGRDDRA